MANPVWPTGNLETLRTREVLKFLGISKTWFYRKILPSPEWVVRSFIEHHKRYFVRIDVEAYKFLNHVDEENFFKDLHPPRIFLWDDQRGAYVEKSPEITLGWWKRRREQNNI